MPLDKPDGAPHNTSRGDPANSPPPTASRSAPDTRQQDLVAAYLALVEQFGAGHRAVKDFVSQHGNNPELKEWTSVVDDLHAKGGSAHRQRSLRRLLWAVSAAVVPLFIVVGVYALLGAGQVQGEMAKVRDERDRAVSESHRLALSLADAEGRVASVRKDATAQGKEQALRSILASKLLMTYHRTRPLYIVKSESGVFSIVPIRPPSDPNVPSDQAADQSPPMGFSATWLSARASSADLPIDEEPIDVEELKPLEPALRELATDPDPDVSKGAYSVLDAIEHAGLTAR